MNLDLPSPGKRKDADGVFPFGLPNSPRPARWDGRGTPHQLVLGVYPSALHINWRAPRAQTDTPVRVSALAVDVEPVVFWNGLDAEDRVAHWVERVGFVTGDGPDTHGHARPALNGPSGSTLNDYFTTAIHPATDTVFADVYPVYLVKRAGPSSKRPQQGDAIDQRFNPFIDHLPDTAVGRPGPATLPTRLRPADLPGAAAERFGPWILDLLRAVRPELVVTLGQEPWTTLGLIQGLRLAHPSPNLAATRTAGYGQPGTLTLDGRDVDWIPLAHPGLLNSPAATRGTPSWREVHAAWAGPDQVTAANEQRQPRW